MFLLTSQMPETASMPELNYDLPYERQEPSAWAITWLSPRVGLSRTLELEVEPNAPGAFQVVATGAILLPHKGCFSSHHQVEAKAAILPFHKTFKQGHSRECLL